MSQPKDGTPATPANPAQLQAESTVFAKTILERNNWQGDDLVNALSLDDNGRKWQARVDLGQLDPDAAAQAVMSDLSALKSRLDFALRKEASRRWQPHINRRMARLRTAIATAVPPLSQDVRRNPALRPMLIWREVIRLLEAEISVLKRRSLEYQAGLNRTEEQLRANQAEIENVLQNPPGSGVLSRLKNVLVNALSRGVNLVTQVMSAERLVNDREEYAYLISLATAATSLLQEAMALAQQAVDEVSHVRSEAETALSQVQQALATAQLRLCPHPYACVDETSLQQVALLQARLNGQTSQMASATAAQFLSGFRLIENDLNAYQDMNAQQLRLQVYERAISQTRQQAANLTLIDVLEMRAQELSALAPQPGLGEVDGQAIFTDAPERPRDLVLDAFRLAADHTGRPALALLPEARPREWWMVGVMDDTNPGYDFGPSLLVSTRRRDQLQFLRVQTDLTLAQLADLEPAQAMLEAMLRERNVYVTHAMLNDASAQRAFALGLACQFIGLQQGAFVWAVADGSPFTNGVTRSLGQTPEAAIQYLAESPGLAKEMLSRCDGLPTHTLITQLENYLSRTASDKSGDGDRDKETEFGMNDLADSLWADCADHVRERLALAHQQRRFVGGAAHEL
jgi:hypothetical protein